MISVLVVEDDFHIARIHSGYVAKTPGFEVAGVAYTGADALRAVQKLKPDLVLLDIYLPDMLGLDVLRRLRGGDYGDTDVIVISGAGEVDKVRAAMRGGVLYYLLKPFQYPALYDQLRHYATVHDHLGALSRIEQSDVDKAFRGQPGGATSLPKGLAPETAKLVRQALSASSEDTSAQECAAITKLARETTRRYLEYFVETGEAEVFLRYGTGRPERRYRPPPRD